MEGTPRSKDRLVPTVRNLLISAIVLWAVSLLLPAFSVHPSGPGGWGGQWMGFQVLLYGLFLGFLCNGWAAYANIFFIICATRLSLKKAPFISLSLMLLCASTLISFKGVPRDEGTGVILEVTHWQIGAFVWAGALLTMAVAVLAQIRLRHGP
jgi:hypothetical protein